MRLTSITIKNFKGIDEQGVRIELETAKVNCGKNF